MVSLFKTVQPDNKENILSWVEKGTKVTCTNLDIIKKIAFFILFGVKMLKEFRISIFQYVI